MKPHGPRKLTGPVRGTNAWWRGLKATATENSVGGSDAPSVPDPKIRWELVARVRQEIADGTYDTPEKWEAALDRLLDRLGE